MGNYNPRQNTRMRWKDARELEKFIFLSGKFNFTDETLEHVLEDELYGKIAIEIIECSKKGNKKGIIIEDTEGNGCYIGEILDDGTATLTQTSIASANSVDLQIDTSDENNVKLIITTAYELVLTGDNVKTLFGQDITGTGNITMYRHQIIIRFDTDTKEVHYVVYSPNKAQIFDYDTFMSVANPISNFNYTAVYVNGNNAEPAFIRFASGTILVGLSTGMEPFTGLADVVSEI